VLALEDPGSSAYARINDEVRAALLDDRAEAIVLGCAGMTDLAQRLSQAHGIPVIDGVAAAVKLAEGLAALGLRTSKRNSYATPLAKAWGGPSPGFMR
jgi:allantoin racemase